MGKGSSDTCREALEIEPKFNLASLNEIQLLALETLEKLHREGPQDEWYSSWQLQKAINQLAVEKGHFNLHVKNADSAARTLGKLRKLGLLESTRRSAYSHSQWSNQKSMQSFWSFTELGKQTLGLDQSSLSDPSIWASETE